MRKIIKKNGEIISLNDWQKEKGYAIQTMLGKYFSTNEKPFSIENWLLHESLFDVINELRERVGLPIKINSGYRTIEKQKELQKTNAGAVSNSPHTWGLALDIDTKTNAQTDAYVEILRQISIDLDIKIRIGWQQYKGLKETFVHIDVAPEMFSIVKSWEFLPNIPNVYKLKIEW